MNFPSVKIRPSLLHLFVFVFFGILILAYVITTKDIGMLTWALPTLIFILLIPLLLTYLSQSQYSDLVPVYEETAREVRIREITEAMISKPIKFEALVEQVRFKSLNRPHFIVGDRTGEIVVKMFTNPQTDIQKGDIVMVYGQVIRRYIFAGDPVVNGVHIRVIQPAKKEQGSSGKKGKKNS